jgi:hypothetical protein
LTILVSDLTLGEKMRLEARPKVAMRSRKNKIRNFMVQR